jgi:serine/threonine protein kinase
MISGRRIGNYQITDYVGSGGFGSVFKAEDVNTPGRVVAIKELHKKHTRNQVIKQRFFQEAVAMARLDHPNLPRLYTFGEDNGAYYLVMEFISGKLLGDELHETGSFRPEQAVVVLTQVLDALSYAHRNGIIHRDLKPDNIILVGESNAFKIKVLDFGIARMVGGENLTLAGEGFGTPAYMAPERITGAGGDDPRMDLYSAGIILFEMLTGKAPFESQASDPALYWAEMRDRHQREPLPSLAPLGVPVELERIAQRATAKQLNDRYQSADEMLSELKGLREMSTYPATVEVTSSRLLLNTAPGAAEVYVDDVLRGTSDLSRGKILIDGLTAGLHTVRVLKDGYNEYRINVALEAGRQTDLQVALSARATVAMPVVENTAAGGFATLKIHGADDVMTALLTVDSLPAGTTLFVGSEPVARAGEDGRATLRLSPGSHEIRASSPTGATAKRIVSVTAQDTAAPQTMSLPLTQSTLSSETLAASASGPSQKGRQIAAAVVVILLLALGTAAYFVLRGPDRNREQVESVSIPPTAESPAAPAQDASKLAQPEIQSSDNHQVSEEKKKAAEAKRQAEREAAAIEAQKKAAETKPADKPEKPATSVTVPLPQPATPTPPAVAQQAPAQARNACVVVSVSDADGQPVPRARVALEEFGDGAAPIRRAGHTGDRGKMRECGFTAGRRIRAAVFGPRGMILGGQTAEVTGMTFIEIRLQKKMDEAPQTQSIPRRKRPFLQRP